MTTHAERKPLVVLDLETTSLDTASARIWEFAATKIWRHSIGNPEPEERGLTPAQDLRFRCNPMVEITAEIVEVCGLEQPDILAIKASRPFKEMAGQVVRFLADADLVGFNIIGYDLPVLWEELARCGIELDLKGRRVIDACNLYKKKNPRNLAAAFKQATGHDLVDAHRASQDVMATNTVMEWLLRQHEDLTWLSAEDLAKESRMDQRVDLAGKIVLNRDLVPCYAIGKARGTPVRDEPSFGAWMLEQDFPSQTKRVLRDLGIEPRKFSR